MCLSWFASVVVARCVIKPDQRKKCPNAVIVMATLLQILWLKNTKLQSMDTHSFSRLDSTFLDSTLIVFNKSVNWFSTSSSGAFLLMVALALSSSALASWALASWALASLVLALSFISSLSTTLSVFIYTPSELDSNPLPFRPSSSYFICFLLY